MVLDFKDEQLCDVLNHIISGLLPHESYDPLSFGLLYPTLTSVLSSKDVRGLHFAFYTVFDKYFSLQNAVNNDMFKVNITRERFENALSNNLPDLVLEPQMEVAALMNEEGKSGDISIPTIQNEAMGIIFQKAMDLYDICFSMQQSYEDAVARVVDLRDAIKANIIETGMQMQRAIMSVGMKYQRRFYRGTRGWIEFAQELVREVAELDILSDKSLVCDSLDLLPQVDQQSGEMLEPLGYYGVPQLDDRTPMLRHRLVVLVAKENTGKTKVITHLIASLIRKGVKPFYACGETDPNTIFMQIVSSYIFQEYGQYFESHELTGKGFEELNESDQQIVRTAKARVVVSGLIINNSMEYDNVTGTFTEAYRKGCEAFFVDHSQSLRGRKGRLMGDLVTNLALDCREFKNHYPVYVMIASHPSTNLKDQLQKEQTKDMQQSPTARSAAPSQEADELFILTETDYLRKQNLLQWITFKRRGAAVPAAFFIKKLFHVSAYVYDAEVQGGDNLDAKELEGMIADVGSADDDEEGLDDIDLDI